jgi:hypothetical protein
VKFVFHITLNLFYFVLTKKKKKKRKKERDSFCSVFVPVSVSVLAQFQIFDRSITISIDRFSIRSIDLNSEGSSWIRSVVEIFTKTSFWSQFVCILIFTFVAIFV